MKLVPIVLVSLLAVGGVATATTATLATGEEAAESSHCSSLPKYALDCARWIAQCVGDSLGGNSCHGLEAAPASAQVAPPDAEEIVECTASQVRQILAGATPLPCTVRA